MSTRDAGQLHLFNAPIKKTDELLSKEDVKKASVWTIHVDGASRGNPGPSGAGIYIYNQTAKKVIVKEGFYLGSKTNNQAEYLALALAVMLLHDLVKQHDELVSVQIISDSELLIKQMQGYYKVKNPMLLSIKQVIDRFLSVVPHSFKHVLREYNKVADHMANVGVDGKKKVPAALREELKNLNLSLP